MENVFNIGELESIIKVEPKVFQTADVNTLSGFNLEWPRLVVYDVFKPRVLLERLDEEEILKFTRPQNEKEQSYSHFRGHPSRQGLVVLENNGQYICDKCGKSFLRRESMCCHLKYKHLVKNYLFCDLCPKSYSLKSLLRHHMQQTHWAKRLACNVCEYRCSLPGKLKHHKNLVHSGKKECPICHIFVSMMKQHLTKEHCDRRITCKVCGNVLKNEYSLTNHMKTMHGKNHKCNDCGKSFNFYDLRTHKLQEHFDGKIYVCHCGKKLKSKNTLRTHRFHVHSPTPCEVCNEICIGNSACNQHWLKNHVNTHGSRKKYKQSMKTTEKGVFKCEPCDTTYSTLMRLRIHQKESHLLAPKTWTCDLCGKLFKIKSFFEKHVEKLHLKKFICEVCDHEAQDAKELKVHRKIHKKRKECPTCHKMVICLGNHLKTHDIVKCECKFCGTVLGNTAKLKVHLAFMHKGGKANKKKCEECDEEFFYLDALKLHVLTTHFKGSLFQCKNCDAIFKNRGELRSHITNMHKLFSCQICCQKFKWQSLLTHWKNQHLEEYGTFTSYKNSRRHFTTNGPFTCDFCNKVYPTRIKISHHFFQHLQFKKRHGYFRHNSKRLSRFPIAEHFCDICGHVFLERKKIRSHMYKHLQTLTNRHERFVAGIPKKIPKSLKMIACFCDICGKEFFVRKKLREHMRNHAYKLKIRYRTNNKTTEYQQSS